MFFKRSNGEFRETDRVTRFKLIKSGKNWLRAATSNFGLLKVIRGQVEETVVAEVREDAVSVKEMTSRGLLKGIVAAGAVLVTSMNALLVGYIVFEKKIPVYLKDVLKVFKDSFQHTTVLVFVIVIMLVIIIKSFFDKGTPLRGGMPSGHSALASSIFTIITYLTHNPKIFFLTLILVVLVMHSRIEGKIHTLFETVMGGLLGWGITYLILSIINM